MSDTRIDEASHYSLQPEICAQGARLHLRFKKTKFTLQALESGWLAMRLLVTGLQSIQKDQMFPDP